MREKLKELRDDFFNNIKQVDDLESLDQIRVMYLGKKGHLSSILKNMKNLDKDERPKIGAISNLLREEIEGEIAKKKKELEGEKLSQKLKKEKIDVTLKTNEINIGHTHPLIKTMNDLEELFINMGFTLYDGPEIETVENNFDLLNAPMDHPSRDMSDTFYFDEKYLLRSQTSPVQIRAMKEDKAPIKMICSGRVFRSDEVDATHSPMFHQLEGLVVDKDISVSNLIYTLDVFVKKFFGENIKTRYRPHYFPFTEPSLEVDTTCLSCHGEGCKACSNTGWSMELLGCGMVHPKVLENCGIDPNIYQGFAFGMGIDRIAMVRYKIDDIRLMFENNIEFLKQF